MPSGKFHPATQNWFKQNFSSPTEIQELAFASLTEKANCLIAAPTGSGKTLAAFLNAIDRLVKLGVANELEDKVYIVYVSPLKALTNDVDKNLQLPLRGIRSQLIDLGYPNLNITSAVRTGDTPTSQRTAMMKKPPHILVTTPETLYLLLTSRGGRNILKGCETVIIDEIHALINDKRGAHLALSLQRLENLVSPFHQLQRIGLSATQKPLQQVADFLSGVEIDKEQHAIPRACTILNKGHKRQWDIQLELPSTPLQSVTSTEQWQDICHQVIELIVKHKTTLIFVNTRRLAERLATQLADLNSGLKIMAHHGSMSREIRLQAEEKLKSGQLNALVATASLELGIDIGSVDLVCQIGCVKRISTFLQRIGRASHHTNGISKGRIFATTRDDLIEAAALLWGIRSGELDAIEIPEKPLDILAQQIVAEVSLQDYNEEELFLNLRQAYPYRNLSYQEYLQVLQMLSEGFTLRNGFKRVYLHHDRILKKIKTRPGSQLTALTSGGAIPDNFDYDVILEPSGTFVGTINEDFAIESMAGDVFQLGSHSWRILRVENGKVRVSDAQGMLPGMPFWLGEGPTRSKELSDFVSRLKIQADKIISTAGVLAFQKWLVSEIGLPESAAQILSEYLFAGQQCFGAVPSQQTIVMERFFDQVGDTHLIIHSTFGSRLNRAWGLALRKRFCRKFNFELQAAANEDAIIISMGKTHSFPLAEVLDYLNPKTVRQVLIQALLDAPLFEVRWRHNASRALAVVRNRGGKKIPGNLQRMNAQDLLALVFPDQVACLENIVGEREIPDHPLIQQTIKDCIEVAMDIEGLEKILSQIQQQQIKIIAKDLSEPSPLSIEIIQARPYAFLDDAPLEERRTRAIMSRRFLNPADAKELGQFNPAAIAKVQSEAWPQIRNSEELYEALQMAGYFTANEIDLSQAVDFWKQLQDQGRACLVVTEKTQLYIAAEQLPRWRIIYPAADFQPHLQLPVELDRPKEENQIDAFLAILRGRLEIKSPTTVRQISEDTGLDTTFIDQTLLALEGEGFIFRGHFTTASFTDSGELEWCERTQLSRIHRYTLDQLRNEIQPVTLQNYMRFLFAWHGIDPSYRFSGSQALSLVMQRLEAYEAPAPLWESKILAARFDQYESTWLDHHLLTGQAQWVRLQASGAQESTTNLSAARLPIAFLLRPANQLLPDTEFNRENLSTLAKTILQVLEDRGAIFSDEIQRQLKKIDIILPTQLETALRELMVKGYIASDSFATLRNLFQSPDKKIRRQPNYQTNRGSSSLGRWSLVERCHYSLWQEASTKEQYLERLADIFLNRYGIIFNKLLEREKLSFFWRDLVRILRRKEARGEIRGGRFVDSVWGEQFAKPEAVTLLRSIRNQKNSSASTMVKIHSSDPVNLLGIILPGIKLSIKADNWALYRDGEAVATKENNKVNFLIELSEQEKSEIRNQLLYSKMTLLEHQNLLRTH